MTKKKQQKKKAREKAIKKKKNIQQNNIAPETCEFCEQGIEHTHETEHFYQDMA